MGTQEELTEALEEVYNLVGKQTGYWAKRFIQKVRRVGGLATVKGMLTPRSAAQRAGLDRILEAGRPDLTVEYVALRPEFRGLFTAEELTHAEQRLADHERASVRLRQERNNLFPDDLDPAHTYIAGARRRVRVNSFERDPQARSACIAHHGCRCAVCDFDFEAVFGAIGSGFIHVHHTTPVASLPDNYRIDPVRELVPVCPNCHAMLHYRVDDPRTIEELRRLRGRLKTTT